MKRYKLFLIPFLIVAFLSMSTVSLICDMGNCAEDFCLELADNHNSGDQDHNSNAVHHCCTTHTADRNYVPQVTSLVAASKLVYTIKDDKYTSRSIYPLLEPPSYIHA